MSRRYRHIVLNPTARVDSYKGVGGGGSKLPPISDIGAHGRRLKRLLEQADQSTSADQIEIDGRLEGVFVEFESFPDFELTLKSLDRKSSGIELRNATTKLVAGKETQYAVVFVPDGQMETFHKLLDDYMTETTEKGHPKNNTLVASIADLRLATVEAFWTENEALFPETDADVWWEVWLHRRDGETQRFAQFVEQIGGRLNRNILYFRDRVVLLYKGTAEQLSRGIISFDDFAELRRPAQTVSFVADLSSVEQYEWVEDLASRLQPPPDDAPRICVLDTGIDNGHPLLAPAINPQDCHHVVGVNAADIDGHGTMMAGISLYENVGEALESSGPYSLGAWVESVKILGPNANDPESYGAITGQAVSRVEISNPDSRRVFAVAVTEEDTGNRQDPHLPTAWSAVIDALAAGQTVDIDDTHITYLNDADDERITRLFIISAGNIPLHKQTKDYLERCDLEPVEDPAQAWNTLTVGAYTEQQNLTDPIFDGWTPLANRGELSPASRTSVLFNSSWPYKPDVVFEGGNTASSPDATTIDQPPSMQILTTKTRAPDNRPLTTMIGTSPATAKAANLAAALQHEYPELWPETIRGLIVNSARWTKPMQNRFDTAQKGKSPKAHLEKLLRRYGWGVPSHERAKRSADNSVTLIGQQTIHPFENGSMRDIHYHDLPWPEQELLNLGEIEVAIRVTLSYFIEPNPSRRAWKGKFRYQSHGLRYAIRYATETDSEFQKRCNANSREEDEEKPESQGNEEWLLGSALRPRGSLVHDVWTGSAADLAERKQLAVYPIGGYWKDQPTHDQSFNGVPYSIIVTIDTPETGIDLWTPTNIANQTAILTQT